MNHSLFMSLSSQVRVADLLTPLQVSLPADLPLEDARDRVKRLALQTGKHSLVTAGDDIVGWIDWWPLRPRTLMPDEDDDDAAAAVRDRMHPLAPSRLLTADTPARRALQLVAAGDPFEPWFVLDGHEFAGTLDYDCFFKAPFKVCLFALVTQLEQRSLWLCARDAKASWDVLSENRRNKATEARSRGRRPDNGLQDAMNELLDSDPAAILGFTTFIDKKTIICKRNLLPTLNGQRLEEVFDKMEMLRNALAHPDTYEEPFIEPQALLEQITSCEKVLQAIEEQILPPPPIEQ